MAIVRQGKEIINGENCWFFAFGTDSPEKFTAGEHYAVSETGMVYILDIFAGGEYVEYIPE